MRVVFDAYWWVEGPLSNQMVQREFLRSWVRDYPTDSVLAVVPSAHVGPARDGLSPGVTVVGTRLRPHAVAAAVALPVAARRHRADVIISHNFTPLTGRSVTFIHDVLFQSNPEWFSRAERGYLAGIPLLAGRANAIATSSVHEAARIRRLNPRLRTVQPVGLAISPELATAVPCRPTRFPSNDSFVLTVGRLNVRKNLARTLLAAADSGVITPTCPLVVVGAADGVTEHLPPEARELRESGAIVFLSHVSTPELAWLYGHARLFVFMSLDEGYGLPPVEAQHFGAPVLASDIRVFRETLGEGARFADPLSRTAIADALRDALRTRPVAAGAVSKHDQWGSCTAALRSLAQTVAQAGSS